MEHDFDRPVGRRFPDRTQDALRVVDVDVACEGNPEQRDRLLPVDQRDHGRLPLARKRSEALPPPGREHLALHGRLQRGKDEEKPEEAERVYGLSSRTAVVYAASRTASRDSSPAPSPPATVANEAVNQARAT